MKILVPVDGSKASENAAKKAFEIAKMYNAAVKIITVVDTGDLPKIGSSERRWQQMSGAMIITPVAEELPAIRDKMKIRAEEILEGILSQVDAEGIKTEKRVLVGEPDQVIADTVLQDKIDLVVMGNRGFSGKRRFFVGSVTERVIAEVTCPVLVVHTDPE